MAEAKELGRLIGGIASDQARLQENVYPDDPSAQLQLLQRDDLVVHLIVSVIKRVYSSTSFVLDHPVYGELDSATLLLDGGYLSGSDNILVHRSNFGEQWIDEGRDTVYPDTTATTATITASSQTISF